MLGCTQGAGLIRAQVPCMLVAVASTPRMPLISARTRIPPDLTTHLVRGSLAGELDHTGEAVAAQEGRAVKRGD